MPTDAHQSILDGSRTSLGRVSAINGSQATITIETGGSAAGELEVQGDSDLFSFTASRAGAAQLRLETGAGFDGKLWAYGGDHEFLKVRNERGPGGDELLEFEVDAGETYFVMIDGWRVPNGDYTVVVDSIDDHADFVPVGRLRPRQIRDMAEQPANRRPQHLQDAQRPVVHG